MPTTKSGVSTYVFCWTVERSDGAGLAVTSHDRSCRVADIVYLPASGIAPAAVTRARGIDREPGEVSGALTSSALTESDLAAGRWRAARTRLTATEWDGEDTLPIRLAEGELGEVATRDGAFSADLIGPSAKMTSPPCPSTSPECRAAFGDYRCRVDLAGRSKRAKAVSLSGSALTVDRECGPEFNSGRVRFLSGSNCGLTAHVLLAKGKELRLREAPRLAVAAGDVLSIREGCDKTFATCRDRFGNAVNFRGEPHLPGNDLLTRYPGV